MVAERGTVTRCILALALLVLAACDGNGGGSEEPSGWIIGPIINGKNYSVGLAESARGDDFTFPSCTNEGSVNYITKTHRAPMTGSMTITYTIEGNGDLVGQDDGSEPKLALYFQRRGDDWQARNGTEVYRWWSRERPVLEPGTHTLTVPLEREFWGPVLNGGQATDAHFAAALADPARVGFTFGGNHGAGHGVCARSGAVRFVLRDFRAE